MFGFHLLPRVYNYSYSINSLGWQLTAVSEINFTPTKTSGGPDIQGLQSSRETFVHMRDEQEVKINDDWTTREDSHRVLEGKWTGRTIFLETLSSPSSKSSFFSTICLVTIATLTLPSLRTSALSSCVYNTQNINEHFDGTLNFFSPFTLLTSSDNEYIPKNSGQNVILSSERVAHN